MKRWTAHARSFDDVDKTVGAIASSTDRSRPAIPDRLLAMQQRSEAQLHEAKNALEARTKELAHSLSLLNATIDSTPDGIVAIGLDGRMTMCNKQYVAMWRLTPALLEAHYRDVVRHCMLRLKNPMDLLAHVERGSADGASANRSRYETTDDRILDRHSFPQYLGDRMIGRVVVWRDVTAEARSEGYATDLRAISERMIAGDPLDRMVPMLFQLASRQMPGALCSLLFLDRAGRRLHVRAADHLPPAYCEAIDGLVIGEGVGSCGTAAFRGERVIVADIDVDPAWQAFRDVAREAGDGLRACWSSPLLDDRKAVLGTFAIYFRQPREPTPLELELLDTISHLAGLVVAHERRTAAIAEHVEQQNLVARFSETAIEKTIDPAELARIAVSKLCRGLGVTHGRVLTVCDDGSGFSCGASIGFDDAAIASDAAVHQPRLASPDAATRPLQLDHVLQSREPVLVDALDEEARFVPDATQAGLRLRSSIEVRLTASGKAFAILGAYSLEPCRFTQDQVRFVQSIARVLEAAMERRQAEQQMAHLALHDSLCGLPNRVLLQERLTRALEHARRDGTQVALMFIDLDRFKNVNDSLGHRTGDALLRQVAERLKATLRTVDTVARQGGDEFIVVLPNVDGEDFVARVAERVGEEIAKIHRIDSDELIVTATIGIALFPDNGDSVEALMRNADAALFAGKELGRNRYQFYSRGMNERAREMLGLEADLHRALARDEFFVEYQPQVDLGTSRVMGLEALIRWRHPTRGIVSPADFIPLAERTGLISAIGGWVLHTACRQFLAWQRAGIVEGRIAVNVSAPQFQQADFVAWVADSLAAIGLAPASLELEVTESVVMHGIELVQRRLEALHRLGVSLSIDDFGTGYSSLSYLKSFPIDRLKIDRSFVQELPDDAGSSAIAKAVIAMGESLRLDVVAEGVETPAQAEHLRAIGCRTGQGFLFARPMGAAACTAYLESCAATTVGRRGAS